MDGSIHLLQVVPGGQHAAVRVLGHGGLSDLTTSSLLAVGTAKFRLGDHLVLQLSFLRLQILRLRNGDSILVIRSLT